MAALGNSQDMPTVMSVPGIYAYACDHGASTPNSTLIHFVKDDRHFIVTDDIAQGEWSRIPLSVVAHMLSLASVKFLIPTSAHQAMATFDRAVSAWVDELTREEETMTDEQQFIGVYDEAKKKTLLDVEHERVRREKYYGRYA